MSLAALGLLAHAHGMETGYIDDRGAHHDADPDVLVAALQALGAPIAGVGDAPDALRSERGQQQRRMVEPVTAGSADGPVAVRLRLPHSTGTDSLRIECRGEDGDTWSIGGHQLVRVGTWQGDGSVSTEYEVMLADAAGRSLGPGYYELTIEDGGRVSSGTVVVAPPCPRPVRGWGVFLSLPALRSDDRRGVGTYPELADMVRWTNDLGGDFVGTLPLFPTFIDAPYDPSPYLPVTRLGWSELFIDPAVTPEAAGSARVGTSVSSPPRPSGAGRGAPADIGYDTVAADLRRTMEPMARALFATPSRRRQALIDFCQSRPELAAYARFRSAREQGRPLPGPSRHPGATRVEDLDEGARYHLYVQWLAEDQLADTDRRLYLDLPVGVHPDGFDAQWEHQLFVDGMEVGAPPDAFFASGQTWGFRPLDPRAVRDDRYRYPIACLRQVMRHAAAVRIDHVMGLHRLYWVPEGGGADHGVYIRYRLEEMQAVVALEAHRAGTAVVGEDLGTVPAIVRESMVAHQMLRSWVLQFEASPEDPLPDPPATSMATIGTHDLPRFAAYWHGDDIEDVVARGAQSDAWGRAERARRRTWREGVAQAAGVPGNTSSGTGLRACLSHLAASPALLAMVDLEDLWLEQRQINRPGSGVGVGNWTGRMSKTVEQIRADSTVVDTLADFAARRRGADATGAVSASPAVRDGSPQPSLSTVNRRGEP